MLSTQDGGAGRVRDLSDCAQSTISSRWVTSAVTANEKGTTNTSNSANVMTVTANQRRLHSNASSCNINGHPATTIIVAQSIAGINGRRIQNEAAMKPTITRTERVDRTRSWGAVDALIGRSHSIGSVSGGCISRFFIFNLLNRLFNRGHKRRGIGQVTLRQLEFRHHHAVVVDKDQTISSFHLTPPNTLA